MQSKRKTTETESEKAGEMVAEGCQVREPNDSFAGELAKLNRLVQESSIPSSSFSRIRLRLCRLLFGFDLIQGLKELQQVNTQSVQITNELASKQLLRDLDIESLFQGELQTLRHRLDETETRMSQQSVQMDEALSIIRDKIAQLDSVSSGLEAILARVGSDRSTLPTEEARGENEEQHEQTELDYSYLLLENRFRGSEATVKERLRPYIQRFTQASAPVLEIGAGRGELQELFVQAGIESYGVELDQAMVQACMEKELPVSYADGIRHLGELEDNSLGGVIAIQVVEHLPITVLKEFLGQCQRTVRPSGYVILETINTSSVVALTQNYFRDPTHAHPLHPDTMSYLAQLSGLEVEAIEFRSDFPEAAKLQTLKPEQHYPESWCRIIQSVNDTVDRLNALLYAPQDYALVAKVK